MKTNLLAKTFFALLLIAFICLCASSDEYSEWPPSEYFKQWRKRDVAFDKSIAAATASASIWYSTRHSQLPDIPPDGPGFIYGVTDVLIDGVLEPRAGFWQFPNRDDPPPRYEPMGNWAAIWSATKIIAVTQVVENLEVTNNFILNGASFSTPTPAPNFQTHAISDATGVKDNIVADVKNDTITWQYGSGFQLSTSPSSDIITIELDGNAFVVVTGSGQAGVTPVAGGYNVDVPILPTATPGASYAHTEDVGDGVSTEIAVDHNLGTSSISVTTIYNVNATTRNPGEMVAASWHIPLASGGADILSTTQVIIEFFSAPAEDEVRVIVLCVGGEDNGGSVVEQDTPTPMATPTPMSTPTPMVAVSAQSVTGTNKGKILTVPHAFFNRNILAGVYSNYSPYARLLVRTEATSQTGVFMHFAQEFADGTYTGFVAEADWSSTFGDNTQTANLVHSQGDEVICQIFASDGEYESNYFRTLYVNDNTLQVQGYNNILSDSMRANVLVASSSVVLNVTTRIAVPHSFDSKEILVQVRQYDGDYVYLGDGGFRVEFVSNDQFDVCLHGDLSGNNYVILYAEAEEISIDNNWFDLFWMLDGSNRLEINGDQGNSDMPLWAYSVNNLYSFEQNINKYIGTVTGTINTYDWQGKTSNPYTIYSYSPTGGHAWKTINSLLVNDYEWWHANTETMTLTIDGLRINGYVDVDQLKFEGTPFATPTPITEPTPQNIFKSIYFYDGGVYQNLISAGNSTDRVFLYFGEGFVVGPTPASNSVMLDFYTPTPQPTYVYTEPTLQPTFNDSAAFHHDGSRAMTGDADFDDNKLQNARIILRVDNSATINEVLANMENYEILFWEP